MLLNYGYSRKDTKATQLAQYGGYDPLLRPARREHAAGMVNLSAAFFRSRCDHDLAITERPISEH
jgi:hypothetical protein